MFYFTNWAKAVNSLWGFMFSKQTHGDFINRFFFRFWCQTCMAGGRDRSLEIFLLCSLYSWYSVIPAFVYSPVPEYPKLFRAVNVGQAEQMNMERWQGFAAVGNEGICNCIIVFHSVLTCNLLKCHFVLQALTLPFPVNLTQPALRHHDSGAGAAVHQPPGGVCIQASPIVDLAIVVCDTYW